MNGLVWGAFLGGVAGMTKDILVTEYQAMQKERKEVARAKPHSFLYEVSDLETSFLCLYENCGQFEPARQKLNIAGKHLDKVGVEIAAGCRVVDKVLRRRQKRSRGAAVGRESARVCPPLRT